MIAPRTVAGFLLVGFLVGLLAGPAPAAAQPSPELPGDDPSPEELLRPSFSKLARMRNEHALRLFGEKKYPEALAAFRDANEMAPEDAEITGNMAYLLQVLGNHEEAETWYRRTLELDPDRAVSLINLADLLAVETHGDLASADLLAEAAGLLVRARELRGNRRDLLLRQARLATRRGLFDEGVRFWSEVEEVGPVDDRFRLEIADFYRSYGREEEALLWYRSLQGEGEAGRQAALRIRQIDLDRQARRLGWLPRGDAVPAQARILTTRARLLGEQGKHDEAERLLREAVALAPGFAAARAALGDVLQAAGRFEEAELACLQALALDHGDPEAHLRLGRLYQAVPGGARAADAAIFLGNALRLRPEDTALHLELARALRAAGALSAAATHAKRYLAEVTDPAGRAEATAILHGIRDVLPDGTPVGDPAAAPDGEAGDTAAAVALTRARVLLAGAEADAALDVLLRIPDADRDATALDLEARCHLARGERGRARRTLQTALIMDEDRPDSHLLLGRLFKEEGEAVRAQEHLERARDGGQAEASWYLADIALGPWREGAKGWLRDLGRRDDLLRAEGHLDHYLETGDERFRADAESLVKRVRSRVRSQRNALIALLAALVLLGFAIFLGARGGVGLNALIRRHPETGPEVQRILAAIRHEILKHNTLLLAGLVEAIELDRDASEKAMLLSQSLFGSGGAGGVREHLMEYVRELEALGRARRLRLNLRLRDPAVGALLRGFDALHAARPLLERETTLEPGERGRLLALLGRASRLLNVEGYEALRGLLDRLRTLAVDAETLRDIVARVRREPAFSQLAVAPSDLVVETKLPVGILVPRAEFEDALGNLVRNAFASAADHDMTPLRVGLRILTKTDPVIGVERVSFHVRDESPARLTTEMIRSRQGVGGLGIASEVAARYEGTIEVIPDEAPWTKAVVMTFDRVHPEENLP